MSFLSNGDKTTDSVKSALKSNPESILWANLGSSFVEVFLNSLANWDFAEANFA